MALAAKRKTAITVGATGVILEYVLVFVLAILAGGWAIPAGVLFGLDPIAVFVAASLGSLAFASLMLFLGDRWRDSIVERLWPDAHERLGDTRSREYLDRWGIPGLAWGSIVVGPSLTLVAALIFNVDRRRFFAWYATATLVGFAALTVFWVLVAEPS